MKTQDAKEYIEDCRKEDGSLCLEELADVIIWAYDKGWEEGIDDYRQAMEEDY